MNETEMSDATPPANSNDDPVATAILAVLSDAGDGKAVSPETAARAYAETRRRKNDPPDLWRRYLNAVRQQAIHLARAGRIEILRKGKPVDPNDFKGVYRLRLKADG
ncbi:MAG: DUF3253 domain-containing protein [Magnetovibrio sp.]|nr:DUF3253 domain-containing protein [Magnetovibrio sp.]